MATLYRKHRPQLFSELIGQNHVKLTLQYEIASGKIAHAYLFCGPRGVGKTTMARLLAKSLNCLNRKEGEYEPCNECDNCRDIREGRGFDIIEIDAASHTGVDNVRENVIASSRISPAKSKFKVFIIDEAHMLSLSAFNALLKVLEEPSPKVIFILCTTEVHKVPSTIISRCQRFDFKKISVKDMVKKLEHIIKLEGFRLDKDILEEIARHSEGHLRDAESLLGQIRAIGGKEITREEAALVIPRSDINEVVGIYEQIAKKDASLALRSVNRMIEEGFELRVFIGNMLEIGRKLLIMKVNPTLAETLSMEYGESIELRLRKLIEELGKTQIIDIINEFSEAKIKMKDASIVQLPIEVALIKLIDGNYPEKTAAAANIIEPAHQSKPSGLPAANSPAIDESPGPESGYDAALNEKWSQVIEKIKHYNHSLSFILEVCRPRNLSKNRLILAFKYKFHKDRLNSPNLKTAVEKAVSDVYGGNFEIEAVLDESIQVGPPENSMDRPLPPASAIQGTAASADGETIDNLLKTFGGRVIQ